jgi:hypothetical protein
MEGIVGVPVVTGKDGEDVEALVASCIIKFNTNVYGSAYMRREWTYRFIEYHWEVKSR